METMARLPPLAAHAPALPLAFGPRGPFVFGAVSVTIAALALRGSATAHASASAGGKFGACAPVRRPTGLVVATAPAFTERFTAGCSVVTFAVHSPDVLGTNAKLVTLVALRRRREALAAREGIVSADGAALDELVV